MPEFVALLRGVNVGKGNRVPMAKFKLALQELGYTSVSTLLNSGNAVFQSSSRAAAKHARAISGILAAEFDVTTPVIVKTAAEFSAIVMDNPFDVPESEYSKLVVAFAQKEIDVAAMTEALPTAKKPEQLAITQAALYLHCPKGILESAVAKALLGRAGQSLTSRNWATVIKLQALLTSAK